MLICTPVRRDAELLAGTIASAGFEVYECRDSSDLRENLDESALALLTTEEALRPAVRDLLERFVVEQPPWSDLPIVIFTGPDSGGRAASVDVLGERANITLVDRPVRLKTLKSVINAVARGRFRQYEMRDLVNKLEARIAERDRFLAILGHELRNPLATIVLAAQMVDPSESTLDAQQAARIERQALHLSRLVDDLLDLSRITTGKITLKRAQVDLNQLVEQALRSLQTGRFRRDLDLKFSPAPSPVIIDGDALRVEQVVTNLLTNAFKYTPEGGSVTVETSVKDGFGELRVSDTGVGIAPDRIDSIFELFSQAENAIGRSQGGMGIGLHLVRSLVELHGGSVRARSEGLGKGSTFTVRLPLAKETPRGDAVVSKHEPAPVCTNRKIVVVDDNADIRDLLQLRLRRLGHVVETAADGHTGLKRIESTRPHVAIIDIGMPGVDGYELAKQVRDAVSRDILLIALTGFGQAEDKEKALAAGFDEHLTKPVRVEELQRIFAERFGAGTPPAD